MTGGLTPPHPHEQHSIMQDLAAITGVAAALGAVVMRGSTLPRGRAAATFQLLYRCSECSAHSNGSFNRMRAVE